MQNLKKINLLQENIIIDNEELSKAFASDTRFGITINGSIKYTPFNEKDIFIYQGHISAQEKVKNTQDVFGKHYLIQKEETHIIINAAEAWTDILTLNLGNCDYAHTLGDGVTEFKNEEIEDMSWMIIDFDVSYKEMIEFLERSTNITLLCIQDDEPCKFKSIAFFDDVLLTQKIFFSFCQNIIKDKLANDPDYTYDYLDEDQVEAVAYFQLTPS
ncbi:hypothetical protein JHD50_00940 [Sulfurimonas sp. MAG313]|nr:hypothetical protein [Sulfurimonas sp. MAG313]MDF1879876.1 hypothetical protein [Sulfurimonas sp. MAG313]